MNREDENDWGKSVAAIVKKEDRILLARHTYGRGKGKLIIPGGYLRKGETPEEAVRREVFEETGITVRPLEIAGIRFNRKDWYVIFTAEYIGGEAVSDGMENSEVVWLPAAEAAEREDVPELSKLLIAAYLQKEAGTLKYESYEGSPENGTYSLYLAK